MDRRMNEIGKETREEINIVEGFGWIWLINKKIKKL